VYRLAEAPNVALVLTPEEVELLIRLRRERQQFPLLPTELLTKSPT